LTARLEADVGKVLDMTEWAGYLTHENKDDVAERIRKTFGGKQYSFVVANEYLDYRPQVRTGQRLTPDWRDSDDPVKVWDDGFSISDTSGCWEVRTGIARGIPTQKQRDEEPYLCFGHDSLMIKLRAPAGTQLYWGMVIEHESDELVELRGLVQELMQSKDLSPYVSSRLNRAAELLQLPLPVSQ
jgi:hypothetical protein